MAKRVARRVPKARRGQRKAVRRIDNKIFVYSDPITILHSRFKHIKLPKSVKDNILADITVWYKRNGKKYTVDRLKYVRQCLVRYYADGTKPPKNHEVWFKKNSKGLLYGSWGTLFKLVKKQPDEVLKLASCYTVFCTDSEPTEQQIRKFANVVEAPFSGDPAWLDTFNERIYRKAKKIINKYVHKFDDIKQPGNFLVSYRANNTGHKDDNVWDILDMLSSPHFRKVADNKDWVFDCFSITKDQIPLPVIPAAFLAGLKPYKMGQVNWINEPGMKERIVTDFKKPLEHLTFPLGERLYDIVERCPWDATFHEERGYNQIQQALREGKTAYCFDLSSATDRFPFSTQMAVMLSLDYGPNYLDQLELLEFAVTSSAELPNGRRLKWSVGQPMGYYPSFAMFSLTHGLVLMTYLYTHAIEYKGQFVVHGDDIVIFDEKLAKFYQQFCDKAGIAINQFKTVTSDKCAEFNSRIVTKDHIINMNKWRPVTFESLTEQIRQWGPVAIQWLPCSRRTKETVKLLFTVPDILAPGRSINPDGMPYEQRLALLPASLREELTSSSVKRKGFVSFRSYIRDRITMNDMFVKHIDVSPVIGNLVLGMMTDALNIADTLDKEILQETLPFMLYMHNGSYADLQSIVGLKDGSVDDYMKVVATYLQEFNSAFCPDLELVSFNFIKELHKPRKHHKHNVCGASRLNKLLNIYYRARARECTSA